MSIPTPIQSFLGGLGLSLPVHSLLLLNGNSFGVSGFLHRAVSGGKEAAAAVAGLIIGGMVVGLLEDAGPEVVTGGLPWVILSGLLVGVGSKMSNGCTSGHMLSGVSRCSKRSIAATTTFFFTGAAATHLIHGNVLPTVAHTDWTLGPNGKTLLALQTVPLGISALLYLSSPTRNHELTADPQTARPSLRILASFFTSFNFAAALRMSNLSEPSRVLSFLILPFHHAFDPSLAYLALGALPLAFLLYRFGYGDQRPRFGGPGATATSANVDARLLSGAALFGVGWALCGICPGPGLVNLGRAFTRRSNIAQFALWVGSVAFGGLLVQ